MTNTVGAKARRFLIAGSVAVVMGLPTLACMGGADTSTDDKSTKEEPKAEEPKSDQGIEEALLNTFKVHPSEGALRELKLIQAAIEGKPPPKKLQPLSDADKQLFQDAKKSSGATQDYFRGLINRMKGARVTFESNGDGRYDFDGGKNPFTYKTSNVSKSSLDIEITYVDGVKEKANMKLKGKAIEVHFTEPGTADYTFKVE